MSDNILSQISEAIISSSKARRAEALEAAHIEIERLRRRIVALEMVILEELPPLSCACDANRMLVEGISDVNQQLTREG